MASLIDMLQNPTYRLRAAWKALANAPATDPRVQALVATPRAAPITTSNPQAVRATTRIVELGQAVTSSEQLRNCADRNEWVRTAVNRLKGRVAKADRVIVPIDHALPYDVIDVQAIARLVEHPAPSSDSWRVFSERWLEDVLVLGKGGFEHVINYQKRPLSLLPYNAARMFVNPEWTGFGGNPYRYIWVQPGYQHNIGIADKDVTLMMMNPSTHRPEGYSPLLTLYETVQSDAFGNSFIRDMLRKHPPPGWIDLGRAASPEVVAGTIERLETDVLGSGGFLVTAGMENASYRSLWQGTSHENDIMAFSVYFARKVAAVYNLSPQDLGIMYDVNRANSEAQLDLSTEDGYKSMLMLVEESINGEVLSRWGDPQKMNIAFRFKELTMRDRLRQAHLLSQLLQISPITINEGRQELDMEPIPGGDSIYVVSPTGLIPLITDNTPVLPAKSEDVPTNITTPNVDDPVNTNSMLLEVLLDILPLDDAQWVREEVIAQCTGLPTTYIQRKWEQRRGRSSAFLPR